jgi:hypothetical protein
MSVQVCGTLWVMVAATARPKTLTCMVSSSSESSLPSPMHALTHDDVRRQPNKTKRPCVLRVQIVPQPNGVTFHTPNAPLSSPVHRRNVAMLRCTQQVGSWQGLRAEMSANRSPLSVKLAGSCQLFGPKRGGSRTSDSIRVSSNNI